MSDTRAYKTDEKIGKEVEAAAPSSDWEVVIGLEVHAQISSDSKLFSRSPTEYGREPNMNVAMYDVSFPGMLPVLNEFCVDQAIKTGLAIEGTINRISIFDRKNYFYPDLPSGYQISQLYHPIVTDGHVTIEIDGLKKNINIERIHIEQDAGKSIHTLSPNNSYIDLNRSGVPLMEIVSKPDMRSAAEAMLYVKKLRMILRYIETCDCSMEKGSIRFDANVSIHKPGTPFGNRAEVKNINSIKFLGQAIDYEVARQIGIVESGGVVVQETRLFDSVNIETRSMRAKEDSADYRYFPDPDLKPVILTEERIERIRATLPELPDAKKERFIKQYCIGPVDADVLVEEVKVADLFEEAVSASRFVDKNSPKLIANWMISELFAVLNKNNRDISDINFPISYLSEMVDLIIDGTISGKIAKTVFANMVETWRRPEQIISELGLVQISDDLVIKRAIAKVLEDNPNKVTEYKAGKLKLFGFLVGMVMKELHGKGNPKMVNDLLQEALR
ncbi:MAG: Asp-tRNA(Asn)/Glu-tRNA(Gln) amidotransferase subunit GatB [Holosporales bacterium]|jgi:aspartyl-tRNA(Asn)/glutamyl-tRNA(Gln) amidotransferase subunit B|nr:Asp-tRNA(Asn)/Glu-tRNA(Gln) amidotransferase subunit GatB [Holosporales bacterium]